MAEAVTVKKLDQSSVLNLVLFAILGLLAYLAFRDAAKPAPPAAPYVEPVIRVDPLNPFLPEPDDNRCPGPRCPNPGPAPRPICPGPRCPLRGDEAAERLAPGSQIHYCFAGNNCRCPYCQRGGAPGDLPAAPQAPALSPAPQAPATPKGAR